MSAWTFCPEHVVPQLTAEQSTGDPRTTRLQETHYAACTHKLKQVLIFLAPVLLDQPSTL
jgi:hypothetical protein